MKALYLVVALAMLVALTGVVTAAETTLTTTIAADQITVTAPDDTTWELSRANINDNNKYVGTVGVISDSSWSLTASDEKETNKGYLMYGDVPSNNWVSILTNIPETYGALTSPQVIGSGGSGSHPVDVYVHHIVAQGETHPGSGQITITFTGMLIS